ncbi:MAG: S-methyl-5-thioribose kinase [Defluviitaleaceae bacterium]|nr:S-methyl-5-thioribose kinase [Defluviitaleaceae bacterium]
MNTTDIIAYVKEHGIFDSTANLSCQEIGDGNINYVFRIADEATGKSVIVKYADELLRSSGRKLCTDRSRIEAETLILHNKLAPGHVPEVYLYDPTARLIVMQDLADYENMRHALLARKTFPTFAEDISTYLAQTLIRTTDNILDPMEKKALVKSMINPEMCLISEKLVFTEPYTNHYGTNAPFEENIEFFEKELYGNEALCLEAAKLQDNFKTNAQALLHGDLHTGSIFVKSGSTMVLDPEFAFYGPIGYDVGNVIANLIFAWVNAEVTMPHSDEKNTFQAWLESAIRDTVDLFYSKALRILKDEATDRIAQTLGFAEWYMQDIMSDTAGMAGLELNRRVIGDAKVADIAGIKDRDARKKAERICVLCANELILGRNERFQSGKDYIATLHKIRLIHKAE